MLPSYGNHSIDLVNNQLTGFYMLGRLIVNGLILKFCFACYNQKIC